MLGRHTYEEGRRISSCRDLKLPETELLSPPDPHEEVKAGARPYEASPGEREAPRAGPEKEVGQVQGKLAEASRSDTPSVLSVSFGLIWVSL